MMKQKRYGWRPQLQLLAACLLWALMTPAAQGQPAGPPLTVEAVLRAVQERKLMLGLKEMVATELDREASQIYFGSTNPYQPATFDTTSLAVWPGVVQAFPANGAIGNDLLKALACLNHALHEFYLLRTSYLTLPPSEAAIHTEIRGGRTGEVRVASGPSLPKFTAENWRENLRQFASDIDQLQALEWPAMGSFVRGGSGWYSSYTDAQGNQADAGRPEHVFDSPTSIAAQNGSRGTSCEWIGCRPLQPVFVWSVMTEGVKKRNDETSARVASELNLCVGVATKGAPMNWPGVTGIPSPSSLSGRFQLFRVGGGSYSGLWENQEFNDALSRSDPETWSPNKATKVKDEAMGAGLLVMGEIARITNPNQVGIAGYYAKCRTLFQLPVLNLTGTWEEWNDQDTLDFYNSIYGSGPLPGHAAAAVLRYKPSCSQPESKLVTRFTEPGANFFYEGARLSALGVYRPKFTRVLPEGARDIDPGIMDAGAVSLLPRQMEPVRVHLGRGQRDRHQQGWLSIRLDGFGTLDFNGSAASDPSAASSTASAFEVLRESNVATFGAAIPLPVPEKGHPQSFLYLPENEIPAPNPLPSTFPFYGQQTGARSQYLSRWHQARLRQVKGGDVLADITYLHAYKKEINFYWASQVAARSGSFYEVGGLTPFKTVIIENPTAGAQPGLAADHRKLKVTEDDSLQHTIVMTSAAGWKFTSEAPAASFKRVRTIDIAYTPGLSTWTEIVKTDDQGTELSNVVNKYSYFPGGYVAGVNVPAARGDPSNTDYPVLLESTMNGTRTTNLTWTGNVMTSPSNRWPTRMTCSGAGWDLNDAAFDFNSTEDGLLKQEVRKLLGKTHTVTHDWDGGACDSTWKLDNSTYATATTVHEDDLQKITVTRAGLATTATFGSPGSAEPWVLTKVTTSPGGYEQTFEHTFEADKTKVVAKEGWGTAHSAGTQTTTEVNRMGALIKRKVETTTTPALTLSEQTGSDYTPWGVPKKVIGQAGEGRVEMDFDSTPGGKYGTLKSVREPFGGLTEVKSRDPLGRLTSVTAGLDTYHMDYSNPLLRQVGGRGTSSSTQISKFGDMERYTSSQSGENPGVVVDLNMTTKTLTVEGRPVALHMTDAREITGTGSFLGSRGSDMTLDVVTVGGQNLLRQTTNVLRQGGAMVHYDVKSYYDEAGRLVKLEQPGPANNTMTEKWSYPDPFTVIYTPPGLGPVLQPETRTLSSDGQTLTISRGGRECERQRRMVIGGDLVMIAEVKDDSDGHSDDWRTVGTQKVNPSTGGGSFQPWDLTTRKIDQSISLPNGGAAAEIKSGTGAAATGANSSKMTLTDGRPSTLTGKMDGVPFNLNSITYNDFGLWMIEGKIAGKDVTVEMNELGRVKRLDGPGFHKHFTYGGAPGYEVTVTDTDQENSSQKFESDALGSTTKISGDGLQPLTTITSDHSDGKTSSTYVGLSLTRENAADGSLLHKSYAGGSLVESISYSLEGLPLESGTGAAHLGIDYSRDGQGRLVRAVSGSGHNVAEGYYHVGLRRSVEGVGEKREFAYQRFQLAEEKHLAGPWSGTTLNYGQDTYGRPGTLSVDGGVEATYTYTDDTSRLAEVSMRGLTATYTHDETTGLLTEVQRGNVTTGRTHDVAGRLTGQSIGNLDHQHVYNARHQRISRTAATGSWTDLEYDNAGRLTSAKVDGKTMRYTYDARGNRTGGGRKLSETSSAMAYTVNLLNQATGIATDVGQRGYGVEGTVAPGAKVRVFHPYHYGPLGEELEVDPETGYFAKWWSAASHGLYGQVFPVEIRVRGILPGAGQGGTDAVADHLEWTIIPPVVEAYEYDNAGRLAEDAVWTYTWDAASRLTGLARKPGAFVPAVTAETISYSYDSDGRRTGRMHRITKNGVQQVTESKVLWDGWLPVCEERSVGGVPLPKRWFVWGEDVSGTRGGAGGVGGLLAIKEENGRTLLPVDDGLGNITAVLDSAGATVAQYGYGPYGEIISESGEVDACPFRYQSKWWDGVAGLNYFGYRHYSPRLGRWLSRDPLGEEGGMNLYAYCGGDPVNKYDYLGMEPISDPIRVEIAKEIQAAIEIIELSVGGTNKNRSVGLVKHSLLEQMLSKSKYAAFMVLEQSINESGGAVKKQTYVNKIGEKVSQWPAGSKRPDVMVLTDSDHKILIEKGGGISLSGKIDAVFDYKTGDLGIEPDWVEEVSKRTGVKPQLILEAKPGKNLPAAFAVARQRLLGGSTRMLGVADVLTMSTDLHHYTVDKMDAMNDQNPYAGITEGGILYSMTFDRKYFTFLPISYKVNHGIRIWNGPFVMEIKISEERWNELNSQLEKSGKTLNDRLWGER